MTPVSRNIGVYSIEAVVIDEIPYPDLRTIRLAVFFPVRHETYFLILYIKSKLLAKAYLKRTAWKQSKHPLRVLEG